MGPGAASRGKAGASSHEAYATNPKNVKAARYFATAMGGLMLLFIIGHWWRCLSLRYRSRAKSGQTSLRATIFRLIRRVMVSKIPGFPSTGHGVLVAVYALVNFFLLFVHLNSTSLDKVAQRLGWLATSNLVLLFILALRNTPLAWLTSYSYERLNVLHQIVGYTTVLLAFLHGMIFTVSRAREHALYNIISDEQQPGIVALGAMVVMLLAALFVRGRFYELFYVIHILGAAGVIVGLGKHRPDMSTGTLTFVFICAALWISDRFLRGARMAWNRPGNRATLTPLVGGGTRVAMNRPLSRAKPGVHVMLWIQKVRALETHPFTVVSVDPLELVVSACDGFTRALHQQAVKHPGISLPASVDGPYGALPDFSTYDRVVLIAGGSGASFTFAIAMDLVRYNSIESRLRIDFVWVVRDYAKLSWFEKELRTLQASPLVNLALYTTAKANATINLEAALATVEMIANKSSDAEKPAIKSSAVTEKQEVNASSTQFSVHSPTSALSPTSVRSPSRPHNVTEGRPDVAGLIREAVEASEPQEKIMVAACGPSSLMDTTRSTVAGCITASGPSVAIHCEQFGW